MSRRNQLGTILAGALASYALAIAAPADAATITVTSNGDSPSGDTLREALQSVDSGSDANGAIAANRSGAYGSDDTVQFNLGPGPQKITLGGSELDVTTTHPLVIAGPGAGLLTVSANNMSRVFNLSGSGPVTISGMTITGGRAPDGGTGDPGGDGGGILNSGSLKLANVALSGNRAGDGSSSAAPFGPTPTGGNGGGIASSGALTLEETTVHGDTAGTGGEGFFFGLYLAAGGAGGGVYVSGGFASISDTTIDANAAGSGPAGNSTDTTGGTGGDGGGIAGTAGTVTVTNSTVEGNSAGAGGQGYNNSGGAGGGGGTGGDGGGVFIDATLTATNSTVAGNVPGPGGQGGTGSSPPSNNGAQGTGGSGGGVDRSSGGSQNPATLVNTLLASNSAGNCAGTVTDGHHDLSFNGTGCPATFASGDPHLGTLQDNGGPTDTMALGAGSAAIDQVPASGADCPATDQRGVSRPQGPACDIGAFEAGPGALGASPSPVAFGGVTLPAGTGPKAVTLADTGGAPVTIDSVKVAGANAADFTLTGDGCSGHTLPIVTSCVVDVSFKPGATGKRTATLAITDSAPAGSLAVPLTGDGKKPTLRSLHATANGVVFSFHCAAPPGTPCQTVETLSAVGTHLGATLSGAKHHRGSLGSATVSVPGGHTKKVVVRLNAAGRRLLARFGKLRVKLTVALKLNQRKVTVATERVRIGSGRAH